jgi:replicative DNA helicase
MYSDTNGPTVPSNLEAERSLLGALLLERDAIIAVAPSLGPGHFYLERHALVYEAILACYQRRIPPDLAMVADELRRKGYLDQVGGHAFLGHLAAEVPTAVHVAYYAQIVERTAVGRALIETGGRIAAIGYDDARPIEERLDQATQLLHRLAVQRQVGRDFVPLAQVASEYLDAVEDMTSGGDLLGLNTGYPGLDAITQGMRPGELIVLAARPGVGKTALALNIAHNVAQRGHWVGIYSMEMDRELLLQRLLAIELNCQTNLVPRLLRRGDRAAIEALARLSELPIEIDHTPTLNVMAIRDRARRLASDRPIDLLVVDYLQLAHGTSHRDDDLTRITAVSQGLMSLARELRVPLLALSQLSRAVESRQSHVPVLSDLRGSGSIEQDASQVWMLYREELYDAETDKRGLAEIHVAKNRNGGTGFTAIRFDPATTRFLPL